MQGVLGRVRAWLGVLAGGVPPLLLRGLGTIPLREFCDSKRLAPPIDATLTAGYSHSVRKIRQRGGIWLIYWHE
jgi:hypothetical protein